MYLKQQIILLLLSVLLILTGCKENLPGRYNSPFELPNLPFDIEGRMVQTSSYDTTGGNNDRINLAPGDTAVIFKTDDPGVILRIWVTIDSRDPYFLRRIKLRMFWDGEVSPSVEVPVGDFFGNGFEYTHFSSLYTGMTSGGYVCYFPMPFDKGARIEVINETGQEVFAFYYQVDWFHPKETVTFLTPRFHALWKREARTTGKTNYRILDISGKGVYVGTHLCMQSYNGSLWYLEGDEMIWADGEEQPSIHGTGLEDYLSSGWYFKNGVYSAPYHGLLLKDEEKGRIAAYRYHIPDPIPFSKSILATIEHGHGNEEIVDISSTAFWYQQEPHQPFPEMLPGNARVPLRVVIPTGCREAEELSLDLEDGTAKVMEMTAFGSEWSGNGQLFIHFNKGGSGRLYLQNLREPEYDIIVYYTTGPEYGDADLLIDGRVRGTIRGYSKETLPRGDVLLQKIVVPDDKLTLVIRPREPARGHEVVMVGIDALNLRPVRKFIPAWNIIGPFPNRRESDLLRYGIDSVFAPEQEINLSQSYQGTGGKALHWKEIETPDDGYISLWDKVEPYEFAVTYALSYIHSPEDMSAPLLFGSDDGIKIFLNDEELFRFLGVRLARADEDEVMLSLKKGWNKLLLKIENNFGGYAFYARIIDKNGNFTYRTKPPE